jgi:hypothetical protein
MPPTVKLSKLRLKEATKAAAPAALAEFGCKSPCNFPVLLG